VSEVAVFVVALLAAEGELSPPVELLELLEPLLPSEDEALEAPPKLLNPNPGVGVVLPHPMAPPGTRPPAYTGSELLPSTVESKLPDPGELFGPNPPNTGIPPQNYAFITLFD